MLTASWRPALIALNLLLLGMIALFAARIVSALVAARLATPAPRAAAPAAAPAVAPASVEPESAYAVIAERDVFNAVKRPGGGGSDDPSAPAAYKRTDLNLKLWGTALAHEPSESFAIIEDQAARRQMLYRVGDTILEVATLARVEWDRVVLSRDGEEEVLEISSARQSGKDAAAPGAVPAAASERIKKTADGKFLIDRRELESTVANINEVFTQARAVPFFQDGKTVGFRVFAIKPGSVFEKIGLQNGDVINRVNGVELTDPTKAISLFTELQNEGHIAVDLQRNKQAKNFSYEIR